MISFRRAAAVVGILLLSAPAALYACPVCFDPREQNRLAFFGTTVFMSLLPLGLVAGVGLWLRKRAREAPPPES